MRRRLLVVALGLILALAALPGAALAEDTEKEIPPPDPLYVCVGIGKVVVLNVNYNNERGLNTAAAMSGDANGPLTSSDCEPDEKDTK